MKKELKYLLGIFFVSIILRSILAFFIRSPTIFSDEYIYLKMAQSFFLDQNFLLNGVSVAKYPPLYSIIISFFYLFGDVNFIYYIIKVFNAVLISSVIFPLYYIAKRYLDFKKAIFISLAASFAAPYFIFNNFIMAENLYYP
ncbi:hypothetical protein HYU23_04545, partial [Candidatus Woesearchaeota archaeon]|nr:hypothetical protein [Candidatus Woesearchaeota archaeon]